MKKVHIAPKDKSFNAPRPLFEVSLVRAVSLGAVMAGLLSSVSPVFASHFSSTGSTVQSVSAGVVSANVAHGRVGVANGDHSCGVDQVVSRGLSSDKKVSAEEQYKKLSANQQFINCDPNGSVIQPITWIADTDAMSRAIAAGVNMRQVAETSEGIQGYFDSFTLRGIGTQLGSNANAESGEDVAIGREAWAKGGGSVALGFSSQALQSESIVIGNYAKAEGMKAIAIGSFANAKGVKAIAIGSFAEAKLGTAIGYGAQSSVEGGIALGDDSKAKVEKWVAGYDPGIGIASMKTSPIWRSTIGAVSVGDVSSGKTRQITGVAAGFEETDAVNIAQLKALKTWVEEEGGTWQLSVNGQNTTKVNKNSSFDLVAGSDNIKIVKSGDRVTFDLNKELVLTSVWTRNVRLIDAGLLIVNGPSVTVAGINASDMKVMGVADGTLFKGSKDAVNASQVYELNSTIATYLGGNANVLENVAPAYTIQSQEYNNVGEAFTGVDTSLTRLSGKINDMVDSILVEQSLGTRRITIGAKTDGAEIKITNREGESRVLSGVKDGDLSAHSTEAVNGAQLYKVDESIKTLGGTVSKVEGKVANLDISVTKLSTNISEYFGGSANILTDKAPTYTIQSHEHGNVGSAFEGVDSALTQLFGKVENILVHQNPGTKVITVGKEVEGSEISVANKNRESRVLSGVKVGELSANSTEVVNGAQLYKLSSNISQYLGGDANILEDTVPTYTIQKQTHNDVGAAFAGVDASLTQLSSRIDDVVGSDLVQQEPGTHKITVGAKVGGSEITINNSDGASRKLTGLKDGEVTADSTDAVTGKQLHEVKQSVDVLTGTLSGVQENVTKLDTNINKYLGGGASILADTAPTYTIQEIEHHDVGAAFAGVDDTLTQLSGKIDGVVNVLNNGLVQQDPIFELITIGAKTGGNEVSIANKNGESRKLTGLANGDVSEGSTEAITGSQLHGVKQSVTNLHNTILEVGRNVTTLDANISEYLGGDSNILEGVSPTYTIQKQSYNNVGAAFAGVDASLTKLQDNINTNTTAVKENALFWSDKEEAFVALHVNKGEGRGVAGNNKLKFLLDGDIVDGSTEAITGNQLYVLNKQLAAYFGGGAGYQDGKWTDPTFTITDFGAQSKNRKQAYNNVAEAFEAVNNSMSSLDDRIQQVETQVNSNSLNWNNDKNAYDASHNGQVGKITDVADGTIAQGSTDAVTGNQLWATNEKIDNLEGKVDDMISGISTLTDGVVTYDKDTDGNKINSITLVGTDDDTPVLIANVADGKVEEGSKQAVNGGQLHGYVKEQTQLALADANKYTDEKIENIVGDAVAQSHAYTDMKFNALSYKINVVQKEARQAAAIGLAVSNLRYNDTPGKLSIAFGSGVWCGQSAFAFGAGYTSEDGDIRSNFSVTTSGGHWGVGAGISFTLN
ncbi:YadA-like family protein [Bartonella schoenbuchensis]|uniref:YadA-like family protein n=1 Tax=Bartonella schoenbuchensis TaxID=165694 RepID=UPI003144E568